MVSAIVTAVRIVSFVVIVIIFAVVANTMAMTARERLAEYATLDECTDGGIGLKRTGMVFVCHERDRAALERRACACLAAARR